MRIALPFVIVLIGVAVVYSRGRRDRVDPSRARSEARTGIDTPSSSSDEAPPEKPAAPAIQAPQVQVAVPSDVDDSGTDAWISNFIERCQFKFSMLEMNPEDHPPDTRPEDAVFTLDGDGGYARIRDYKAMSVAEQDAAFGVVEHQVNLSWLTNEWTVHRIREGHALEFRIHDDDDESEFEQVQKGLGRYWVRWDDSETGFTYLVDQEPFLSHAEYRSMKSTIKSERQRFRSTFARKFSASIALTPRP